MPTLKLTIRARFIIYIIEDSRPDAASLNGPQMGHCAGALCRDLISRPSCPVLLAAAVFSAIWSYGSCDAVAEAPLIYDLKPASTRIICIGGPTRKHTPPNRPLRPFARC
jgi:hypothetical protein